MLLAVGENYIWYLIWFLLFAITFSRKIEKATNLMDKKQQPKMAKNDEFAEITILQHTTHIIFFWNCLNLKK